MTYTKLTRTQHMVAMDFVATAREEVVSERNDLNNAQFEYNKIKEAFKS